MILILWVIETIIRWFQNTFNPQVFYRRSNKVNDTLKLET